MKHSSNPVGGANINFWFTVDLAILFKRVTTKSILNIFSFSNLCNKTDEIPPHTQTKAIWLLFSAENSQTLRFKDFSSTVCKLHDLQKTKYPRFLKWGACYSFLLYLSICWSQNKFILRFECRVKLF